MKYTALIFVVTIILIVLQSFLFISTANNPSNTEDAFHFKLQPDTADFYLEIILEKRFEKILIPGDWLIPPEDSLEGFYVTGINTKDNIYFVPYFLQEAHFDVGIKTGKNSCSVVIKEQFTTEFQVQLVVELINSLKDGFRLLFQIPIIVKTCFWRHRRSSFVSPDATLYLL